MDPKNNTPSFLKLIDTILLSKHKEKPQTTESHVEEGVAGDSVGDFQLPNFESIFNDTDDYKFDRHIAALIEMEDAKKLVSVCVQIINRSYYIY
ncbi:hypothetical protein HanPSC8_Chr09g0396101 [Helianthus annuus]|nr:hypothetical protein HanPSC8_Chr09g0396101 [Helianthus annuus]